MRSLTSHLKLSRLRFGLKTGWEGIIFHPKPFIIMTNTWKNQINMVSAAAARRFIISWCCFRIHQLYLSVQKIYLTKNRTNICTYMHAQVVRYYNLGFTNTFEFGLWQQTNLAVTGAMHMCAGFFFLKLGRLGFGWKTGWEGIIFLSKPLLLWKIPENENQINRGLCSKQVHHQLVLSQDSSTVSVCSKIKLTKTE